VSESKVLLDLVQAKLDEFCATKRLEFQQISPDLVPLVDYASALLAGGKRFRALFCYWSWVGALSASPYNQSEEDRSKATNCMVGITAALEMFHAAALVHDDLLDQSDTRRGVPAVHRRFEALHRHNQFAGDSVRFGVAGAVLVGDLMLGWSSDLFEDALAAAPSRNLATAARSEYSKMRTEVMAGQYLDVLEENAAPLRPLNEAVGRANRVMLYKTAKYSIEAPLLLGAAFAGAESGTLRSLSAFGIPLGMAFQLRDDILGVFGDPAITGKPAGDDLREGKRTVLVALTRETLLPSAAKIFDEMLMLRELTDAQIVFLQQTIKAVEH